MKAHNSLYILVTNFCKIQHKFVAFIIFSHTFSCECVFSLLLMVETYKLVPESVGRN